MASEAFIKVDPETSIVTFVHRMPFDPVQGMGKTRDELSKIGFFVNDIPEPKTQLGRRAIAHYDHERKEIYYEYKVIPFDTKNRLDLIESSYNDLMLMVGSLLQPQVEEPINKVSTIASPIAKIATMSVKESDDSKVITEEDMKQQIEMKGIAKYLAYQIYQGRLDKEEVLATYPYLNSLIIEFLKEFDGDEEDE